MTSIWCWGVTNDEWVGAYERVKGHIDRIMVQSKEGLRLENNGEFRRRKVEEIKKRYPMKIMEKKDMRTIGSFWGICKTCGYKVVNTSPPDSDNEHNDYWWYCSNTDCEHHHPGEGTGDMDCPGWVELDPKK